MAGDPAVVLNQHRSSVYAFIRSRGFSGDDADDLTQETLIRAYRSLPGFRGSSIHAWLFVIARNLTVDHLRRQGIPTLPLDAACIQPSREHDPQLHLAADVRSQVAALIDEMPEEQRRLLRLRYYEDRTLAEIAALIHCTPAAAKLRLFRAVGALRRRWQSRKAVAEV
jgi:RNA polymerase sigma-70 factor (ECF subfamily)